MRRTAALLLLLCGCSSPASAPPKEADERPREIVRVSPVTDLQFNDYQLQVIAMDLIREARLRGIEEVAGRNRVERLLVLESSLGNSHLALDRVNELTRHLTAADASRWAKLRQRAELELSTRNDPEARRVRAMLSRWRQEKSAIAFRYLSSNYTRFISGMEWERRFHEFVAVRPEDTAAWAWLLLRDDPQAPLGRYGRADPETAYRTYLGATGAADARTARLLFRAAAE